MLHTFKIKTRRWRLDFENWNYARKYRKKFGEIPKFEMFLIKENHFSGRKLNIIYLSDYDGTFSVNNTYLPLQEIGNVFRFEMDPEDNRKKWYAKKREVNEKMITFVKNVISEHPIDVIVCYQSGRTLTDETLAFYDSLSIPIINETLDDERKFISRKGPDGKYRGMKDICRFFDLTLTTSKSALIKYAVEGGKAMYKPYAANPNVYRKLGLEKKYDVAFVGAYYGTRPYYIKYLRDNGINVFAKGQGWEEGEATPVEMVEIFNQAKIVLGFAGVGISDDIFILKGRDFEVPLTGSLYMTQRHDELKEYFDLGTDIETFATKEELLEKVHYYLNQDEKREQIAQHGYEKCLNLYTAKAAYEKIFGFLGL